MTELPSIRDICTPREDVLSGLSDRFTANLTQVVMGTAPSVYQDPSEFFLNTYPTEGLRATIHEVFSRLSMEGSGTPVIKLETSLGGGKTHTLIALYHLAKKGSSSIQSGLVKGLKFGPMNVAAVIGTDVKTTIWGDIARQLKGERGYKLIEKCDKSMTTPTESELRTLFGKEKSLILIDELALYLAKASAVGVLNSNLAEQTVIFLQTLTQVASSMDNVCLVITSLNKNDVFGRQTEELSKILNEDIKEAKASEALQGADNVLSRLVQNLTPTRGEEFPAIIRYRLFKNINRAAALEVCKAFHSNLNSPGVKEYMPKQSTEVKYLEFLQESYPFHPEFIQILRTKTASITNFNQTRGVLRLLSLLIKDLWDGKTDTVIIHPYHINLRKSLFTNELISRLDKSEYMAAVTADIADTRGTPRATMIDENFSEPFGTWICTTVFLNSLTGVTGADIKRGCNESEIQLAIHRPGLDPKTVENAIKDVEDKCFYLVKQGSTYSFNTEPNLNKLIEEAKRSIEGTKVLSECEKRIEQIFSGRKLFEPRIFARSPSDVPDDTGKPKLVVTHFDDCNTTGGTVKIPELVERLYNEQGTQGKPRIFSNNILFLVCDKTEKERMLLKAREFLALKKLWQDIEEGSPGLQALSKTQRDKIKEKKQESELYLKVSIILAYKHFFLPTIQKSMEDVTIKKPLRKISSRVTDSDVEKQVRSNGSEEEAILNFLKDNDAARTADEDPWAPDLILDKFWPKNSDNISGDEFKKLFFKNPDAKLVFAEDLIIRAQQKGVQISKWYAVRGEYFYDKNNSVTFTGGFTPDIQLILVNTDTGKETWTKFYCLKCNKRKNDCTCSVEKCPKCGNILSRCICEEERKCPICGKVNCSGHGSKIHNIERKTMSGIIGELSAWLSDNNVETIEKINLRSQDRNDLAKLILAIPQFQGAIIKFEIEAVLNKQHIKGNLMSLRFVGDKKGFDQVKNVLINYESKENFSSSNLNISFSWEKGIPSGELITLLRDKVANFTGDSIYSASVVSMEKESA